MYLVIYMPYFIKWPLYLYVIIISILQMQKLPPGGKKRRGNNVKIQEKKKLWDREREILHGPQCYIPRSSSRMMSQKRPF